VPDENGAGIRHEGAGLTVTRSWFHDNQNGILTGANPDSDIVIRRSRFFRSGNGDGYTHNLYVGAVRSLTVTGSYLWGADVGHELKSRALTNTIIGNRIADGEAAASYSIDLPNGGSSLIAGNVVIQGPNSENSALVSYGAEGFADGSRRLWVVNNTFVNRRPSGTFVGLAEGSRAQLRNNLLVGPGELTNLDGVPASANLRVGLADFVDAANDDFRLTSSSPAIDRGVRVPRRWRAQWEYNHPTKRVRRPVVGRVDTGAHEWRPAQGRSESPAGIKPSWAAWRRTASLSAASTNGVSCAHLPEIRSTRPSPGSSRTSRMYTARIRAGCERTISA
jgi:hypothetical protein